MQYKHDLRELTRATNAVLFEIVEDTAKEFSDGIASRWTRERLEEESSRFLDRLLKLRNSFMLPHQEELLRALHREDLLENVPQER